MPTTRKSRAGFALFSVTSERTQSAESMDCGDFAEAGDWLMGGNAFLIRHGDTEARRKRRNAGQPQELIVPDQGSRRGRHTRRMKFNGSPAQNRRLYDLYELFLLSNFSVPLCLRGEATW